MEADSYNHYTLKIYKSACRCLAVNGEKISHFIAPDTEVGKQKLYVLKDDNGIFYVGITSRPMSARLYSGFKADGKHGYYGYKWIGKITSADLLIWCFRDNKQGFAEAIEGELVYLIRNRTGEWPKYQMEIHFHGASEKQRQIAESILSQCLNQ